MNNSNNQSDKNSSRTSNDPIVLFDGVCNFCNFWVDFIIKRDKKKLFRFAAIQTDSGREILKRFPIETEGIDSVILIKDDKCYTKSSAALNIAKMLDGIWPVLFMFIIIPGFIRDLLYDLVAKNRYRFFGKKESCRLPDPDEKSRFI